MFRPNLFQPDLPEQFEGDRILLRRWRPMDAEALFAVIDESRARLRQWMFWIDDHQTVGDTEHFLSMSSANWDARIDLGLAIIERGSGRIIGSSGFHNINWKVPSLEVGYWVSDQDEGKGYVTEAVKLQLGIAFNDLQAERVAITCDPANSRSRIIPERLGFVTEGIMRNHVRKPDGLLRDTLLLSMTPAEYRRQP